jgi:hypothetical protein
MFYSTYPRAKNPFRRGTISTVDLLVPTSMDQLLFIPKNAAVKRFIVHTPRQGILLEGDERVQLTTLYQLVWISSFLYRKIQQ